MHPYQQDVEEIIDSLKSSLQGLTSEEAQVAP